MKKSKNILIPARKTVLHNLCKWSIALAFLGSPAFIVSPRAEVCELKTLQATKNITGKVTDIKGEPIIGANVSVKGTTNGTITDMDGNFSLDVPEKAVISISYIGYTSKEITVNNQNTYTVKLAEDMQNLAEVVVVSYGTQKKRDVTGAISKVDAEDLADIPAGQFAQKLQGQAAGVQINQTTGQPGQGMAFRIR